MGKKVHTVRTDLLLAVLISLFISMVFYFITRAVFVAFTEYSTLEKVLSIVFLGAEGFLLFQAVGFFFNMVRLHTEHTEYAALHDITEYPRVAIFIPARHEPKAVLEDTVAACYNLAYPQKEIYILDDSSQEKYKAEAAEIAGRFGVRIFSRSEQSRHGAKAGIINDCLRECECPYIALFDCDQNPMPGFLHAIMPFLETYPQLALVQTPQFYSNINDSKVAYGAQMQQAVFYEYVCEGKSSGGAMICCGTNVVIRRTALDETGGLDESSVTEDFATSFYLHLKGWQTLYYNRISTFGLGPETLGAYFKQQFRWALGNVGMLTKIARCWVRDPSALKPLQWFEYCVTASYYLIGWAYLFLVICPMTYIFFNIPSYFMDPVVYTAAFLPYLLLSYGVFYASMVGRHYSVRDILKGHAMFFLTLPVYLKASLCGLIGIRGSFQVTEKGSVRHTPYESLLPQLVFIAICIAAITWGCERFWYERSVALVFNIFWVFYHLIFMLSLFYYNEE